MFIVNQWLSTVEHARLGALKNFKEVMNIKVPVSSLYLFSADSKKIFCIELIVKLLLEKQFVMLFSFFLILKAFFVYHSLS